MADCDHEGLQISMGGKRLYCADCDKLWVAEKDVAEMRERAAKEAEICGSTRAAERIRSLPLEPE